MTRYYMIDGVRHPIPTQGDVMTRNPVNEDPIWDETQDTRKSVGISQADMDTLREMGRSRHVLATPNPEPGELHLDIDHGDHPPKIGALNQFDPLPGWQPLTGEPLEMELLAQPAGKGTWEITEGPADQPNPDTIRMNGDTYVRKGLTLTIGEAFSMEGEMPDVVTLPDGTRYRKEGTRDHGPRFISTADPGPKPWGDVAMRLVPLPESTFQTAAGAAKSADDARVWVIACLADGVPPYYLGYVEGAGTAERIVRGLNFGSEQVSGISPWAMFPLLPFLDWVMEGGDTLDE